MQAYYRLLCECLWFLRDEVTDPEMTPSLLEERRTSLVEQLDEEVLAIEADDEWKTSEDTDILLASELPASWTPLIRPPSSKYRFAAQGPLLNGGTRLTIQAKTPEDLLASVSQYHELTSLIATPR